MADYFTNFSLLVPLPTEDAQKYALDLAHAATVTYQGDEPPANFPASLAEVIDDWQFDTDADQTSGSWGLWLHSDSGSIDAVCAFIQHLLQKFNPEGRVSFEWSHDCSKPCVEAFGGGAAIITAEAIKSICTNQWLQEQAEADAQAPA